MSAKISRNIIYVDCTNSIDNIRIAEKSIWVDEIPKQDYNVYYLLMNDRKSKIAKDKSNNTTITRRYRSFVLSYIIFVFNLIKLIRKLNPYFIVVRNRVDLSTFVFLLSKVYKFRFIYIKAFPVIESSLLRTKNTIKRLFLQLSLKWEVCIMRRTHLLIVRSEKYKEYLLEKFNVNSESIIVPMGINTSMIEEIDRDEKEKLREEYTLKKPFTGIYFGAMSKGRKVDFVIDILHEVNKRANNLDFLIVGGNEDDIERLSSYTQNKELNLHFTGTVPREKLFKLLQIADFSISAIPPIERFIISSPTKVFESMALKCPVLANKEIIEQNEAITQSEGGVLLNYNKEEYVDTIFQILDGKFNLKNMGDKGYQYVIQNRSYEKMATRIIEELEKQE